MRAIPTSKKEANLYLSRQNINNERLEKLIPFISGLMTLDLSYNLFDNLGLQQLAKVLPRCSCLHTLNISYNPHLTSEGISILLEALPSCPSLKILDNRGNPFSESALENFCNIITSTSLSELNLDDCKLEAENIWKSITFLYEFSWKFSLPSLGQQFLTLPDPVFQSLQRGFKNILTLHKKTWNIMMEPLLPTVCCELISSYIEIDNNMIDDLFYKIMKHILKDLTHRSWQINYQKRFYTPVYLNEATPAFSSTIANALRISPSKSIAYPMIFLEMSISFYREKAILESKEGIDPISKFYKQPTTILKEKTSYEWKRGEQKNSYFTFVSPNVTFEDLKPKLTSFADSFRRTFSYVNFNLKMNKIWSKEIPLSYVPEELLIKHLPTIRVVPMSL